MNTIELIHPTSPVSTPHLRNIALTVHELEKGEFYWVLLETADNMVEDALSYVPLEAATNPQVTYSSALVAGLAVLRRLFSTHGPRS